MRIESGRIKSVRVEDNFKTYRGIKSECVYTMGNKESECLISIVIPTYCRSKMLREALYSIKRQKKVSCLWEVVVVDNEPEKKGKISDTERIVRESGISNISYYRHEKNMGVAGNYNRGIELAKGEWVAFLHDDDLLGNDYLRKMSKYIYCAKKSHGKKVGGIRSTYIGFRKVSEVNWYEKTKNRERHWTSDGLLRFTRLDTLLFADSPTGVPSCGTVLLKEALLRSGGFTEKYGMCGDMYPGYRIMKDYKFYVTSDIMGYYRAGDNTTSKAESMLRLIESREQFMQMVYRRNILTRIYGKIFGPVLLKGHVDYFVWLAATLGVPLDLTAVQRIYRVKECRYRRKMMVPVWNAKIAWRKLFVKKCNKVRLDEGRKYNEKDLYENL